MPMFRNLLVGALLLGAPAVASAQTVIVDDFSSWSGLTGWTNPVVDDGILPIPGSANQRFVLNDSYISGAVSRYTVEKTETGSLAIDYGTLSCLANNYCRSGGSIAFLYTSLSFNRPFDLSKFAGLQVTGSGVATGQWKAQHMEVSFRDNDPRRSVWTVRKMLDGANGDFVVDFSLMPKGFGLERIVDFTVKFGRDEGYGYSFEPTMHNGGNYNLQDIRLLGSLPVNEVPEPESLPLLGAAAAAALVVGARRRKRAETSKG
ncbi:PEP-CTERM sorting domain-containing protein [Gemmatimonas sp.]|jgi:hypothetical protein|uniref:PEP-CTERM sorting domain-containing protein n=1 Tax=Gemmatimonas sp. TaxID=1962908 RepID=UPI0037BEB056